MRLFLSSIFALAALCACGGSPSPAPFDSAASERLLMSAARWAAPAHPDLRKSWISAELAHSKTPVLFVSDSGTADVYIYALSTLKVVGTITGFSQPQGECSDGKGNVWITDTNAATIYELSHHGQLDNELSDPDGYPDGCAWDATTGSLAVMNLFGGSGADGSVLVYVKGSGTPTAYTNSSQYYYNFGGYDGAGNLFFDGRDENGNFILSELPKGAKSAHTIQVTGGTIYFPGMVQWDSTKKDLIVGDQSCGNVYVSCLYAVKVAKKTGTIDGTTDLLNSAGGQVCDLVQGVEFGGQIAGSDNDFCGSGASTTYLWPYPAGGNPTKYNDGTDSTPVGATISQ